jgi:hypothetical protein
MGVCGLRVRAYGAWLVRAQSGHITEHLREDEDAQVLLWLSSYLTARA